MVVSILLLIVFVALVALVGDASLSAIQWVVLGFAAYFGGRAVSEFLVFAWLRNLIIKWQGRPGEKIPEYKRVLVEFIHCPYCTGTWVAIVLYSLLAVHPPIGNPLLFILGAAGIHSVITTVTHRLNR